MICGIEVMDRIDGNVAGVAGIRVLSTKYTKLHEEKKEKENWRTRLKR